MDTIKWNQAVDMVIKNRYNYIALLVTPWHIQSFEAAKMMIERDRQNVLKGICLIRAHSRTGFCVQDDNFTYKTGDNNNEFFYLEEEEIHCAFLEKIIYCFNLKKKKSLSLFFCLMSQAMQFRLILIICLITRKKLLRL